MGESKRKSRRLQAETAVLKAMGEVSAAFEGDEPSIQFLLLSPDRAEETRRLLGGLPERVERALRSMRASSAAATGRGYVQWWRSSDGREAATIIVDLHDGLFESEVRRIALTAWARGYCCARGKRVMARVEKALAKIGRSPGQRAVEPLVICQRPFRAA
jgi:hypothetical protein